MGRFAGRFGPHAPDGTYVPHRHDERTFDTGEITMNHVIAGDPARQPLLLIPAQAESWWGYEDAIDLLVDDFHVHAVDLRGQGRSTRTPGRYTADIMGNDLVRFIDHVIGRPTVVAGLSSGAVLAAWLSAYAPPGRIVGAVLEDPPLFHAETHPAVGHSIRQGIGPAFALWGKYLGPQWSIGDWHGLCAAVGDAAAWQLDFASAGGASEPPQHLKEYDPEWALATCGGAMYASCDHATMLSRVRTPILVTHHFHLIDEPTGALLGALSDVQREEVVALVERTGRPIEVQDHPDVGHHLHAEDPARYAGIVRAWASDAVHRSTAG